MAQWGFWDWIAYSGIFVAAVIEATEAALMKAHEIRRRLPKFLKSSNWAFVPLGLLLLSAVIFITKSLYFPQNELMNNINSTNIQGKDDAMRLQKVIISNKQNNVSEVSVNANQSAFLILDFVAFEPKEYASRYIHWTWLKTDEIVPFVQSNMDTILDGKLFLSFRNYTLTTPDKLGLGTCPVKTDSYGCHFDIAQNTLLVLSFDSPLSKEDEIVLVSDDTLPKWGICSTWYRRCGSGDGVFDGGIGIDAMSCGGADDGSDVGEELRTPV